MTYRANFQFYCRDHDYGWSMTEEGGNPGCPRCNPDVLLEERDELLAQRARIAALLKTFYQAGATISSLQPVLDLAVALNPELLPKSWRPFATTGRVCADDSEIEYWLPRVVTHDEE